ncbi:hypothetical protein Ais01nite_77740 [Asanoa ishikariensis]|uniref:DUF1877 family protein n=1 Tax=Asanoa ishikariensis TaxID=137265 RepID=A0A1H3KR94_9ACTN|nr:hypothetical protein [Asanoa ishikariensis]GIF69739.1 hypothetical protein Ais01nite_77740 [Asanoa ishikariensis]SDY54703.1 hypothetical protein SAMN05421684_0294 [Asanoa ishikariensis]
MSSIITFFVAPDHATAAGVAKGGPGRDLQVAEYGNFAVWAAIEEWESILLDRDLEEIIATGGADVLTGGEDEPIVLFLPPALTQALASAGDDVLGSTATRWVALRADDGDVIDEELARAMLNDLATLATAAEDSKGGLYVWIS